ncbi:MAG: RDD family protein [Acidobacteria bacterium]|nr:RDD family protein [Acidobacteriota bacterium]
MDIPSSGPPPLQRELAKPSTRFFAAVIDFVLGLVLLAIPWLGIVLCIVYGLVKDALPFLDGKSIGKRAMGIRAVKDPGGESLTGDYPTAIVRQISLAIPIFNIVDALMVLSTSRRRFGDQWAKTMVVVDP